MAPVRITEALPALNVPPVLFQLPTRLILLTTADKVAPSMVRFPETVMAPPSVAPAPGAITRLPSVAEGMFTPGVIKLAALV